MNGWDEAQQWFEVNGYEVVWTRPPSVLVGRRRPERRLKPMSDREYPDQEMVAILIDQTTLATTIAQARVNLGIRWRAKNPGQRSVVILAHRDIGEAELLMVRGHDQTVRWPVANYPRL